MKKENPFRKFPLGLIVIIFLVWTYPFLPRYGKWPFLFPLTILVLLLPILGILLGKGEAIDFGEAKSRNKTTLLIMEVFISLVMLFLIFVVLVGSGWGTDGVVMTYLLILSLLGFALRRVNQIRMVASV